VQTRIDDAAPVTGPHHEILSRCFSAAFSLAPLAARLREGFSVPRALVLAAAFPGALPAQEIVLALPVACSLGESCYIQHYVDRRAGPGVEDHRCGSASYDGHDGTDFALPTLAAMSAGVEVRAAADGRVRGRRDGEADGAFVAGGSVSGKECGNGVVIDHPGGWQTQYCHLRQGSVAVASGETVAAGTRLGLVGMSGLAEFPHLHLTVRQGKTAVDPFHPDASAACTSPPVRTLWQDPPGYQGGGLLQVGLAASPPDFAAVKAGLPPSGDLPADTPALLLWAYGFDSRAGDRITYAITGPQGFAFTTDVVLDKPQALFFRYAGKRAPTTGLPPGRYSAQLTLSRDGAILASRRAEIRVAAR